MYMKSVQCPTANLVVRIRVSEGADFLDPSGGILAQEMRWPTWWRHTCPDVLLRTTSILVVFRRPNYDALTDYYLREAKNELDQGPPRTSKVRPPLVSTAT